jgi:hypothetical protein
MNLLRLLLALSSNKEQQPHNRQPVDSVTPYQSKFPVAVERSNGAEPLSLRENGVVA